MNYKVREEWLNAAIKELKKLFKRAGYVIPKKIRVSCGWPKGNIKKTLGQCWSRESSKDKTFEIFISPSIDKPDNKSGILATLIHELVHAIVGIKQGHKAAFKHCAVKVGLAGRMTATIAGKELLVGIKQIAKHLGPYPHAALKPGSHPMIKKQGTRLIKVGCPKCDYIARVTRIHLNDKGAPLCPVHKIQFNEQE